MQCIRQLASSEVSETGEEGGGGGRGRREGEEASSEVSGTVVYTAWF